MYRKSTSEQSKIVMKIMIFLAILMQLQIVASGRCEGDEVAVRIKVTVNYKLQALSESYEKKTKIVASREFKDNYFGLSLSGKMSKAARGALSFASRRVTEKNDYKFEDSEGYRKYQPNYLQLIQHVKSEFTIGKTSAKQVEVLYIRAVHEDDRDDFKLKDLEDLNKKYLRTHFPEPEDESKMRGNTYTSTTCEAPKCRNLKNEALKECALKGPVGCPGYLFISIHPEQFFEKCTID